MANNFRLTGNAYVSKAGSDPNDGLTKDTPKASIGGAFAVINTGNLVIGSGTYEESLQLKGGVTYLADGNVKLKGSGSNNLTNSGVNATLSNLTVENYLSITVAAIRFTNCLVLNTAGVTAINAGNNGVHNNTIFYNCNFQAGNTVFTNCIFINCNVYGAQFINCYFNAYSTYRATSTANQDYNNIMCRMFNNAGAAYANLAAYQADPANTGLNGNSINQQPKFNNSEKLDFTLQYDSPHIGAGQGATNIGGTSYAKPFVANVSPQWNVNTGAIISSSDGATPDLVLNGTDYQIAPGKTKGTITSAPIRLSDNPVIISQLMYNGFMLYNKSLPGGSATNQNVPDANVFPNAGGVAGANPDRLSMELRWTTDDIQPASETDWLNQYTTAAGAFIKVEINRQPFVDALGYGNGSASFNAGANYQISAIWIQLRITLTNEYV